MDQVIDRGVEATCGWVSRLVGVLGYLALAFAHAPRTHGTQGGNGQTVAMCGKACTVARQHSRLLQLIAAILQVLQCITAIIISSIKSTIKSSTQSTFISYPFSCHACGTSSSPLARGTGRQRRGREHFSTERCSLRRVLVYCSTACLRLRICLGEAAVAGLEDLSQIVILALGVGVASSWQVATSVTTACLYLLLHSACWARWVEGLYVWC
mmetsp:Transcript_27483/g.44240  ORF Transcript_27483/g.44240 Transcript_27483/m.44240 type:complete len:212 (+) Transcript_27483:315-950(+)